jgi:stage V sporulation protein R
MINSELKRLQKLETRIYQIAEENGLTFCDIEFDVIPQEKMFEMMAYGMPGQISNWKFGRDYEKTRTIYERMGVGLPYEVVVNTNPARAYLMKDNTLALQTLIIAHVVGHVAFFSMNQYHKENDSDIASKLIVASQRFEEYERKYGVEIVEATIDAGHSIMFHSNPWLKEETEQEKLDRIFEKIKKKKHDKSVTEFGDMFEDDDEKAEVDREKWNHKVYMTLRNKIPVEPQEDILRFLIDHSRNLADWQKDILETIRNMGRYYWPNIKTKYMNEGFATYWHEKILRQLFKENLLNHDEHSEINYSNSLVKAKSPYSMNPYLVGAEIWEDIIKRWDKGQHGREWDEIEDFDQKQNFDDGSMKGKEKMMKVLRTSNDWMFMHNFLTNDLVRELKLYLYVKKENVFFEELIVTDKTANEVKDIIIRSFSHSGIPKVYIKDGNFDGKGHLLLEHEFIGAELDPEYAQKTLEHIEFLWGDNSVLKARWGGQDKKYIAKKSQLVGEFNMEDMEYAPTNERT